MDMKRIAITQGDPAGIGPEVIVKALSSREVRRCCRAIVIGNADTVEEAVRRSGLRLRVRPVSTAAGLDSAPGIINVLHVSSRRSSMKCRPSVSAGRAVVRYIEKAVDCAVQREVDAIVTGPISKESLKMAGYGWPGHTELLAELTDAKDAAMMFVSKRLRLILCTIHIPLRKVPGKITEPLVLRTIRCAQKGMAMLGRGAPRIAVAGLNPHGGEAGIMGDEEGRIILPAVKKAQREGLDVSGPFPPDVVFHKAWNGEFDIIVCMYHDQGLIPFKMLAFDTGVNVTVGLPIIRTSPDHGTAFDIAWKNRASPSSMIEAIKLAAKMKLPG